MLNIIRHFVFIIIAILLFNSPLYAKKVSNFHANNGVIDLSDWDFNKDGNVKLNGDWEFYWNIFLMDTSIRDQSNGELNYLYVPQLWNSYLKDKGIKTSHGYASYRLKILLDTEEELALKFLSSATSCEIFIDGVSCFRS
jgi:hypothetical protein